MTSPDARSKPGFVLTGRHVLAMVVGFFALVAAVDIGFAVMAYRSDPGQVSANPYETGLAFNTVIARREQARALGWTLAADVEHGRIGGRKLVVAVADAAGAPVRGLKVEGGLARPATDAGARALVFDETAPGRYEALAPEAPGAWDLTVRVEGEDGAGLDAEARLEWR